MAEKIYFVAKTVDFDLRDILGATTSQKDARLYMTKIAEGDTDNFEMWDGGKHISYTKDENVTDLTVQESMLYLSDKPKSDSIYVLVEKVSIDSYEYRLHAAFVDLKEASSEMLESVPNMMSELMGYAEEIQMTASAGYNVKFMENHYTETGEIYQADNLGELRIYEVPFIKEPIDYNDLSSAYLVYSKVEPQYLSPLLITKSYEMAKGAVGIHLEKLNTRLSATSVENTSTRLSILSDAGYINAPFGDIASVSIQNAKLLDYDGTNAFCLMVCKENSCELSVFISSHMENLINIADEYKTQYFIEKFPSYYRGTHYKTQDRIFLYLRKIPDVDLKPDEREAD